MFNIGFTELVILAIIGLIVIGPEQLPEMARKIARVLNDLKRAKDEIMSPVEEIKQEAFRAVEKVRTETEKVRMQAEQELNQSLSSAIRDLSKKPVLVEKPEATQISEKEDKGDGSTT
jgi:sec-independent protein translocase protein TatB